MDKSSFTPELLAHREKLMQILKKYLPPPAVSYCSDLIIHYKLHLHIEVERKDRLGDYSPHLGLGNRISINHNLNPYDFLITFMHELAHFTAHKKYGNDHQAHGPEWKEEFKIRMRPVVQNKFFPPDLEVPLIRHMRKPAYTHTGDVELMKALRHYDPITDEVILDELATGSLFKIGKRGRVRMVKGDKRRTYIKCLAPDSGREYLVHAVTRVIPL
jgi:hypothetical protein